MTQRNGCTESKRLIRPSHTLRYYTPVMGRAKLKPVRCIETACDALRCVFQHVINLAPDFEISQLFIVRFSNDLQQRDGYFMDFHVICESKLSVKLF